MPPEDLPNQQHQRQLQFYYDDTLSRTSGGADHIHMPLIERTESDECSDNKPTFFQAFQESKAGPQIVLLITLLALGLGSVIGVVRAFVSFLRIVLLHSSLTILFLCSHLPIYTS